MARLVRIVAFVSGLVLVALVSGTFLWEYGAGGFTVPLSAAIGTLIAMLASQVLFRKLLVGGASIIGGITGGAVGGSAISDSGVMGYTNSGIPMAPYLVFMGSVLGGAIWIVTLSIVPFNRERRLWRLLGKCKHPTDGREKTSEYLLVSLGSLVIGPVLGLAYFLIEYVTGNIATVDEWPVLGYAIRGPVGAVLCAASVGAIGGLLFAVPYFMAWFVQVAARGPGQQSSDADTDSRKQLAE